MIIPKLPKSTLSFEIEVKITLRALTIGLKFKVDETANYNAKTAPSLILKV